MSNLLRYTIVILFLLCIFPTNNALSDDNGSSISERVRSQMDNITIHGFINQAFGISDGEQIHGIGSKGTADYRTAALQIGYQPTEQDQFIFQIQHRALGDSPLNQFNPPIDLDWVFYEHRFLDQGLSIRAGKIQIPIGIFNEYRDVGTILPLYRAPINIYQEGLWMSETLNGVAFSTDHSAGKWRITTDWYAGFWNIIVVDFLKQEYTETDLRAGAGTRVWIETPIDGLRFGGSAYRADWPDNIITPIKNDVLVMAMGSAEWVHDYITLRSEYQQLWFNDLKAKTRAYYAQAVLPIYGGLNFVGQADFWWITTPLSMQTQKALNITQSRFDTKTNEDYSLGMKYDINEWLSLKLEAHRTRTVFSETRPIVLFTEPLKKSQYFISSLAFSF